MRPTLLLLVPAGVFVCALAQAQSWSPFAPVTSPTPSSAPGAPTPALSNWNPPGGSPASPAAPSAPAAASSSAPAPPPAASSSAPAPSSSAPPASSAAPAPPAGPAPSAAPAPAPAATESWAEAHPIEAFYRRAPPPPPDRWRTTGLLGVEVELRGGPMVPDTSASPVLAPSLYAAAAGDPTGDILRGKERPYAYDPFGVGIAVGYRLVPWLSVGGYFEYASFQAQDGTDTGDYVDGTSQLQRTVLTGGVYGRYYLTTLSDTLHPWVELGLGYAYDSASYVRPTIQGSTAQPTTVDYYLTYQAFVTSLRVGLDWRLGPIFSVGPVFGYTRSFGLQACVDAEPQTDSMNSTSLASNNTCNSSTVQRNDYGIFFGGIFAKVTLGPDVR